MSRLAGGLILVSLLSLGASPAVATSGTTCSCPVKAGKATMKVFRHHRWACDYKAGYRKEGASKPGRKTCTAAEIRDFKSWICQKNGCAYRS